MLNKSLAAIVLIAMLVSLAQPIYAFSSSGTGKWVAGQYNSGIKTTDSNGVIIRRLTNYTTNEKITVFCAEFGVDSSTGVVESAQHIVPTDPLMKTACKIAYFGWYSRYGEYAVDGGILTEGFKQVKIDYVFTQQMIWEVLGQSNATFIDSNIQNQYISFKEQINSSIENIQKKPSFCDITITLDIGQTITLTDTNGVLANYTTIDKTIEGIRIVHVKGENTITVTVNPDCTLEKYTISEETMKSWGFIKEETKDDDTTVYFSFKDGVQDQLYSMNYNDPVTMTMNLQINLLGKLELSKLDEDGKLIDGAIFQINGPDNFSKEVAVTNGKITVDKLKKGTYTVKEKIAPNGYLLNTNTYTVEVVVNQTTTQAIVNGKPTGTFSLVKKNTDGTATIEGTKYRIWNNKGYDKQFTTNSQGKITVTGLELGTYNYKEIQAKNGYLLDTNTYTFELKYKDQNTRVIYANAERTNSEPTGTITIIKKDSETGQTAQGDTTLENAAYKVYANEDIYNVAKTKKFYSKGDLVATRTTNSKGQTEDVTNLPLGKYLVKEEKAPTGYMIDKTQYEVNLTYKDQNTKIITQNVTSTDKVKKMQVHIYKTGIKENSGLVVGLAGAEFTIKLYADIERALNEGYSYAEIWNGLDEYGNTVNVDKNRVAKAQKIAPNYEIITSNSNGDAYTQNKLPYGKYIVKETKIPENFIGAMDFTFSITQDESEIEEIAQKVKHLVVNNEQLATYIKIIKKDAKTGKRITLSSSTFEIKATEDIQDVTTGEILYPKGQAITQKIGSTTYSSFTTNADNIVVLANSFNTSSDDKGTVTTPLLLPAGSYEITEVKAPEGFILLDKSIAFKIENIKDLDRNQDGDCIMEIIIENEQPTGTLIVNKKIATREDVDTSLIDISDLSGVQFKLTAKEDVIDLADGSVIYKKGQAINTYNIDKNGDLKVEGLPMGIYELQEVKTLEGLVLDTTKYEVKFTQKDQVTNVYTETKEITNDTTLTEISKTDTTGEKQLVGAKLTVIDEDGEVIDSWTTTEETHKIEGLIVGKKYTLREEIAPEGYTIAEDIEFTVRNDKETQLVVMKDIPILKTIKIIKADSETKEIIKAKFKFGIYEDQECTKLIKEVDSVPENGTVIFNDLTYGTYYIKEIEAPNGYLLSDKIVKIEINDKGTFADGELLKDDKSICTFTYYNQQIPMIQTGNERNYTLLLSSLLISLSGLLFIISKKQVFKSNKKFNKKSRR